MVEKSQIPILHLKNVHDKEKMIDLCTDFYRKFQNNQIVPSETYKTLNIELSQNPIVNKKCDICIDKDLSKPRVFVRKIEWENHLRSKGHKANSKIKK